MPRRVVRRRGRGVGGDVGSWLGNKAGNAIGSWLGFGRRRRVKRRVGGSALNSIIRAAVMPGGFAGMGMRRRRRRVGGFSVPQWLKPSLTKFKDAVGKKAGDWVGSKVSPAAGNYVKHGIHLLGKHFGFGRRRKRGGRVYSQLLL